MRANQTFRREAKQKGVFLWEVADELQISESYLSRILRKELPESKRAAFLHALDTVAARHQGEGA